jgi:2-keto-4-pentenoate hydratase/2-oxohepta-3-ene-1,7-dioic acid hydratase in catechol pathway
MKNIMVAIATICLLWTAAVTVHTSEAATVIAGAIIGIDQTQRTITYQTEDGRTWTLPVADSDILKQEQIAKGDQVRVEVELNDSDMSKRITKITKISDQPPSKPNGKP